MMKKVLPFVSAFVCAGTIGCSSATEPAETISTDPANPEVFALAELSDSNGSTVGEVAFARDASAITLSITVSNVASGEKAFHLHTTGLCEAPDFKSAGGHLNPFDASHGRLSDDGKHLGDLPNITVAEDGTATSTATLEGTPEELTAILFDDDGTAVMIHAGPDDYISDPAGAAGPRIACGVVQRTN